MLHIFVAKNLALLLNLPGEKICGQNICSHGKENCIMIGQKYIARLIIPQEYLDRSKLRNKKITFMLLFNMFLQIPGFRSGKVTFITKKPDKISVFC